MDRKQSEFIEEDITDSDQIGFFRSGANRRTTWLKIKNSFLDFLAVNFLIGSPSSVAALAAMSPPLNAAIMTKGCIVAGDGGHGLFLVEAATGTPDGFSRVLLANGYHGVLQRVNGEYNALQLGATINSGSSSTAAIQRGIDRLAAQGGGTLRLPGGDYTITASALSEVYDNDGVAVPAVDCGVVVRPNVNLVGPENGRARLFGNPLISVIAMIAPQNCTIQGVTVDGTWEPGESGAGHGILMLSSTGGADRTCKNVKIKNVTVGNVASYGIGFQTGVPQDCSVQDVDIFNTGADGLDLKARSDSGEPTGNYAINVTVRNHNLRVDGSAGVDVRGIWHLKNIQVLDFGGNASKSYNGVRFRTKPPVTSTYNRAAARSTLDGFYVRPTLGAAATEINGIYSGSDDVVVSSGTIEDCTNGVKIEGNANGSPMRNTFVAVTSVNSRVYGFRSTVGCEDITYIGCESVGALTAGFRNESARTKFIGCTSTSESSPLSNSSGASGSAVTIGCGFGVDSQISITQAANGRVSVTAVGSSTDIDLQLAAKGAGRVRMGTFTSNADAPIAGFIEIKDSGGTIRKLAIIS